LRKAANQGHAMAQFNLGVWSDGYGGGSIGRVTDGDTLAGGAALLLLLRR